MAIVQSPFEAQEPDVSTEPLHTLLMRNFPKFANSIAFVDLDTNKTFTFQQIRNMAASISNALVNRFGFQKGDILATFWENRPEFAAVLLGTMAAGGALTGANPAYTSTELHRQLEDCGARILVTTSSLKKTVLEAVKGLPEGQVRVVFLWDSTVAEPPIFEPLSLLFNAPPVFPDVKINPGTDLAFLPYSSGTMGLPKGTMQTHSAMSHLFPKEGGLMGLRYYQGEYNILMQPYFHIGGFASLITGLYNGSPSLILPRFHPQRYLEAIQRFQPTVALCVPTLLNFLAKNDLVSKYNLSSLKRIYYGAAPSGEELLRQLTKRLPNVKDYIQIYGMTEGGFVTATPEISPKLLPPATSGMACPGHQIKFVSTDGRNSLLGPFEQGELCVKGPSLMKGYWKKPDQTREAIDADGWLHSGDIGYFDRAGYIFITDRLKDLIKYKGYQVAPAELEDILLKHEAVEEVAVIGIPDKMDPYVGELPTAFVLLKPKFTPSRAIAEEMQRLVASHTAPYKHLRGGVNFVSEMPKGGSGKVLRRTLRTDGQKYILTNLKSKL